MDAWAERPAAAGRLYLDLRNTLAAERLLDGLLERTMDAHRILAAWRERRPPAADVPLPPPEAAGTEDPAGLSVGVGDDGRLTLVDPALGEAARDDDFGRELHQEAVRALRRLIEAAGASNQLAPWRQAAEEVLDRLGSGPREVHRRVVLRIEQLRALRQADERRRTEPDPLHAPAEAGAAATLRTAEAALNLYVDTDPEVAAFQRGLANPEARPTLALDAAAAAEADLEPAGIAEPALVDELRRGREVAATGGAAGTRAKAWLDASWHNVVVQAMRQTLEVLRDVARVARDRVDDLRPGAEITVDAALDALERDGRAPCSGRKRIAHLGGGRAGAGRDPREGPRAGRQMAHRAVGPEPERPRKPPPQQPGGQRPAQAVRRAVGKARGAGAESPCGVAFLPPFRPEPGGCCGRAAPACPHRRGPSAPSGTRSPGSRRRPPPGA